MEKIELECGGCGAILRVDRRFAGKQARCPSCSGLTTIPGDPARREDAVPAPDSVNRPFQETFYPSDNPYPQAPPEPEPAPQTKYLSAGEEIRQTSPIRYTEEVRTGPEPTYSGGSYYPPRAVANDGRSIVAGIAGFGLLGLSVLSLPVCFCVTPFLLISSNSLIRMTPGSARSVGTNLVVIVGLIWVLRLFVLFSFFR